LFEVITDIVMQMHLNVTRKHQQCIYIVYGWLSV